MRTTANLERPVDGIVRLMLYDDGTTTWLFLYDRREDAPSAAAERFDDADAARRSARERFGVEPDGWTWIPDPRVGDRDDLIAARRAAAEGCGG